MKETRYKEEIIELNAETFGGVDGCQRVKCSAVKQGVFPVEGCWAGNQTYVSPI